MRQYRHPVRDWTLEVPAGSGRGRRKRARGRPARALRRGRRTILILAASLDVLLLERPPQPALRRLPREGGRAVGTAPGRGREPRDSALADRRGAGPRAHRRLRRRSDRARDPASRSLPRRDDDRRRELTSTARRGGPPRIRPIHRARRACQTPAFSSARLQASSAGAGPMHETALARSSRSRSILAEKASSTAWAVTAPWAASPAIPTS